ncbi:MAG: ATP-binding protein [Methanoregula sp.]|uniref:ATP-binding protein n=1 Tax=Methanoregula sp. TaxID=2052170 RepID=UPI003C36027B
MTPSASIVIPALLDAIPGVSFELEQYLRSSGFSDEQILDLQLAVEEVITNTIMHGYAGTPGTIAICCRAEQDEVTVQISDDAPAFDPLQVPEPDTSADLDDRVIGGLGIFLIRKVTDNATYRYEKAKNIMTLTKKRRPLS